MEYNGRRPGNGWWNCPFPPAWVERMKRAAKACESLTAEHVASAMKNAKLRFKLPPGDFLSEEQDVRGLPLSWCRNEAERFKGWADCCTAIYDYDTVPEVVATNGHDDWPLKMREKALTAG